jgi:hypothetical protein
MMSTRFEKAGPRNESPVQSPTPILLFSFKVVITQRLLPELASLPPCPAGSGITSPSPLSDSKPSTCFPRIPAYSTRTPFELPRHREVQRPVLQHVPHRPVHQPKPIRVPTRRPKSLAWVACVAHTEGRQEHGNRPGARQTEAGRIVVTGEAVMNFD